MLLITLRGNGETSLRASQLVVIRLPRKPSKRIHEATVPETDTGRRGENPQVLGRTLVKELGKMTP